MRQYEPAWKKLKAEGKVVIAAHPLVHARIYKALRKEKDMDLVYKLQCEDDGKQARLYSTRNASQLIISLRLYPVYRISRSDF